MLVDQFTLHQASECQFEFGARFQQCIDRPHLSADLSVLRGAPRRRVRLHHHNFDGARLAAANDGIVGDMDQRCVRVGAEPWYQLYHHRPP